MKSYVFDPRIFVYPKCIKAISSEINDFFLSRAEVTEPLQQDWLVNVEFDHFLLTQKLRRSIASYMLLLQQAGCEWVPVWVIMGNHR